jgi:tetratricopeptide (TPR) repeat protein
MDAVKALFSEIAERGNEHLLNSLAWTMAVSTDAKLRDGPQAVLLAEQAVKLTHRKDDAILDTLAAAYAEAGRFEEAIRVQKEALSLSKGISSYSQRLKLYEAKTPYRED